jgi:cytochrome P450
VVAIFREELEKRKVRKHDGNDDLLDGLIQMKDENGEPLSDTEILDNIVSFIIGGYESTALASMWAIVNTSKAPEVLHKLRVRYLGDLTHFTCLKKFLNQCVSFFLCRKRTWK